MKNPLFIVCTAALLLASCVGGSKKSPQTLEEIYNVMCAQLDSLEQDTALTDAEIVDKQYALMLQNYQDHKEDSLGYEVFRLMVLFDHKAEEIIQMYDEASAMIHDSQLIKTKVEALSHIKDVQVGMDYQNVQGVDALTGDTLSLCAFVGRGKPVLLDFWASWCPPCRREIKHHLVSLASEGKVQIVGIAVWEESIDDTRRAMDELGISWPVIYTGGRENSPTVRYGIVGIPTLLLIDADGKILSRGNTVKELGEF